MDRPKIMPHQDTGQRFLIKKQGVLMIRNMYFFLLLCVSVTSMPAQEIDSVQIHGFVTQGLIYSSHNNYLEKQTSSGDPGWTEAVLSLSDTPLPKLRVGIQFHYFHLSDMGSEIPMIDWALGDYRFNDYFGLRAGKVKTPLGLFNDSQDIDAVLLWCLLPQSTYELDNRSYFLSHYGGEVYGSVPLGPKAGKISYRAYGGENSLDLDGGFVEQISIATGMVFATPPAGPVYGGDIRWQTPYKPLMVGSSLFVQHQTGVAPTGTLALRGLIPAYYAQFDNGKIYLAGEYRPQQVQVNLQLGPYPSSDPDSQHQWYVMTAYHATRKLQLGIYYSSLVDQNLPKNQQGSNSKDLVLSARYDFSANFYAKAENHFLHGTEIEFYPDDNPGGLASRTDVVVAKVGFYF
jgi:hypothetical protein